MNIIYDPIKEFIRLVLGLNEHQPITWIQKIFVFGCVIFLILLFVIVGLA